MSLSLLPHIPIEVLEHALNFLDGNIRPVLTTCSLVCRGLLPACRSLLWRDVDLNVGSFKLKDQLAKLSEILVLCPDIGYLVHSFTVSCAQRSELSLEGAIHLCRLFPALRSLKLFGVDCASLPRLFLLIGSIHTLDALYLFNIGDHSHSSGPRPLPYLPPLPYITALSDGRSDYSRNTSPKPNLRVLSIVARRRTRDAVFRDITSALRRSSALETSHLRSLDLRVIGCQKDIPRVEVPSCAPQLIHFGIVIRDLTEKGAIDRLGREHMRRVFADLPKCSRLRSLCLQYDGSAVYSDRRYLRTEIYGPAAISRRPSISPFFLLELSDLLSAPDAPPFPDLETLSLVFLTPLDWLSSCSAAFARLAQACLSTNGDDLGTRRYPRFTCLEIQMMTSDMVFLIGQRQQVWQARACFVKAKERIFPMFTSFTQAGIQVKILWIDRMYQSRRD
ncbi:hypothetical protein C8Q73DRAFT_178503 [Cubamyces lactineus]|nr:hypothetical protein C8Q73DRAFT_178503 [Cubamyces lactineus]